MPPNRSLALLQTKGRGDCDQESSRESFVPRKGQVKNRYRAFRPRQLSFYNLRASAEAGWTDDSSNESIQQTRPSCKKTISFDDADDSKREVRFSTNIIVHHIDKASDMSHSRRNQIWYNEKEYREIEESYNCTVHLMERGEHEEGECHTSRGLELRTEEGNWRFYKKQKDACDVVLIEQERQRKSRIANGNLIATLYERQSEFCRNEALQKGLEDARAVRDYVKNLKRQLKRVGLISSGR